jgi:hypothetical protein
MSRLRGFSNEQRDISKLHPVLCFGVTDTRDVSLRCGLRLSDLNQRIWRRLGPENIWPTRSKY